MKYALSQLANELTLLVLVNIEAYPRLSTFCGTKDKVSGFDKLSSNNCFRTT